MGFVQANVVQRLTGLSPDQLREWTLRRGLIPPDVVPDGPGSRALFAWQTVLLLRIAVVLKDKLHVELEAYRGCLATLRAKLAETSFLSLRGCVLVLTAEGTAAILSPLGVSAEGHGNRLIIDLEPHLNALSTGFGDMEPVRQLTLFPLAVVR